MNIKKSILGAAASGLMFGSTATAVLAAPPTVGTSPAAPNAQCDTAASSGAFNFQNLVYGEQGTPGQGESFNSSGFGLAGGSGGGQTGINNSSVCGNPQN